MHVDEARRRFASSPVARLATVRPDGTPHIVPITFAVDGDTVYSVIDAKPKRNRQLQRLANLRTQPSCALLVDHYEDDWSRLWWVRADGVAAIVEVPAAGATSAETGLALLSARYPAYAAARPPGPLVVITVTRWTGWAASS